MFLICAQNLPSVALVTSRIHTVLPVSRSREKTLGTSAVASYDRLMDQLVAHALIRNLLREMSDFLTCIQELVRETTLEIISMLVLRWWRRQRFASHQEEEIESPRGILPIIIDRVVENVVVKLIQFSYDNAINYFYSYRRPTE